MSATDLTVSTEQTSDYRELGIIKNSYQARNLLIASRWGKRARLMHSPLRTKVQRRPSASWVAVARLEGPRNHLNPSATSMSVNHTVAFSRLPGCGPICGEQGPRAFPAARSPSLVVSVPCPSSTNRPQPKIQGYAGLRRRKHRTYLEGFLYSAADR